jgi:hypothetical protein
LLCVFSGGTQRLFGRRFAFAGSRAQATNPRGKAVDVKGKVPSNPER